jgi:hypothetical protein
MPRYSWNTAKVNIKSIALATVQELDVQNDNINKLTSTVDSANQRIQEHDKPEAVDFQRGDYHCW